MATKQRISAKDIIIAIGDKIVGGAESLTTTISRDNTVAHEAGTYFPAEIVQGALKIEGEVTRAFIDVDLLNEICPNRNLWPEFTIVGEVVSGKAPQRRITIKGATFKSFNIADMALEGYAKNTLPFDALNWELSK